MICGAINNGLRYSKNKTNIYIYKQNSNSKSSIDQDEISDADPFDIAKILKVKSLTNNILKLRIQVFLNSYVH